MTEHFGRQYVEVDADFFACTAALVAPRLIGCVLHHDDRGRETAIMLIDVEAYGGGNDRASHLHPDNRSRRNKGAKNLTPHGTARIHGSRDMWAMDIVCGDEGLGSTVLVRAGLPVIGIEIMTERRSQADAADRVVKNRARGYEKKLCNAPFNLGEAMGFYPVLDGASLLQGPFRLLRPVEPVAGLLNGPRVRVTQDVDLLWRWGHPDHQVWMKDKFKNGLGMTDPIRIPADFGPHARTIMPGGPPRMGRRPRAGRARARDGDPRPSGGRTGDAADPARPRRRRQAARLWPRRRSRVRARRRRLDARHRAGVRQARRRHRRDRPQLQWLGRLAQRAARRPLARTHDFGVRVIEVPLVGEVGAFITDGAGLAVTTRSCLLSRNPHLEQAAITRLFGRFGIHTVIWLDGDRREPITSGHPNGFMAFPIVPSSSKQSTAAITTVGL